VRIDEELMEIWPNEVCDKAARSRNPQSTPRFAPASAHPEYKSLFRLRDMFPDLLIEKVLAMH